MLNKEVEELIKNLIKRFSIKNLQGLSLAKNSDFELYQKRLFSSFEDEFFIEAYEIGQVKLKDNSLLKVYAIKVATIKVATNLTERNSKKQFDLANF